MPRELVAIAPRQPVLREYDEPPLRPQQVRIRSEFSAPKHGTELGTYRGTSPFSVRRWDPEWSMFFPREEEAPASFPFRLGNMTVGVVTEAGEDAHRYRPGDRVFGHFPIRETHTVDETRIDGLVSEGMSPHAVVYWDPAEFALGAVRDAQIRLGERVAVFGLGAIGFMVLQMARLSGAAWVAAVDPISKRRELGLRHGADLALDPSACDVSLEIKKQTERIGPDVAIETSGAYPALHESIRCCALGGRVVPLAFYQGEAAGLRLGEEWHMNRVTVLSSRAITDPNRDHPMWDSARLKETAFTLLRTGRLSVEGLIDPIVPFEQSAEAYRAIDERPWESVKLGVVYD
jgi:threonine dehydrogenase-like Zn-dependent dehydrogenase